MTENKKNYFVFSQKKRTGPFKVSDIEEKINQGSLTPKDLIISTGMKDWVRLDEFDEFNELLEAKKTNHKTIISDKLSDLSKNKDKIVDKIKAHSPLNGSLADKSNIVIKKLEKLADKEKVSAIINKGCELVENKFTKIENFNKLRNRFAKAYPKFPFGLIGLISSTILVLIIIPLVFFLIRDDENNHLETASETHVQRVWKPEKSVKSMDGSNWINISSEENARFKQISFSDNSATVLWQDGEEKKFELTGLFGAEDFSSEMTEDFIVFRLYSEFEETFRYRVIKKSVVPLTGWSSTDMAQFQMAIDPGFKDDKYYSFSENKYRGLVENKLGYFKYLKNNFSTIERQQTKINDTLVIATNSLLIVDPWSISPNFLISE